MQHYGIMSKFAMEFAKCKVIIERHIIYITCTRYRMKVILANDADNFYMFSIEHVDIERYDGINWNVVSRLCPHYYTVPCRYFLVTLNTSPFHIDNVDEHNNFILEFVHCARRAR